MKPIDKKDMPKLIALIAVAVIAFGYGIFTFMSGTGAQTPPPAPAAKTDKDGANGAPKGDEVAADDGLWHPDNLPVSLPTGARDPFMPEGATAPKATPSPVPPATPAPESTPLPRPVGPQMSPSNWPAPILKIGKGPRIKAVSIKPTPMPTPVPAPVPELKLSGVIVSDEAARSVVIVADETKGNRFLSIGDAAGNGWRVSAIKQREIEITDPKTGRRKTVEMK